MSKRFILTALGYAILGMLLGIYMAASQNHSQMVTHAHILLVGFVVSFVYGMLYRSWPLSDSGALPSAQFYTHQAGTVIMIVGLYMLYGNLADPGLLEPILAIGSILVLVGMICMKVNFLKGSKVQG